jgi:hypothetical protein
MISLSFLFQINEHYVLTLFISLPVSVFQNFMVLSVVPPPVASKPFCHGHHARAFTAALCPFKVNLYLPAFMSQMTAVLSLLPDANPEASCLSPHTSALCPSNLDITLFGLFMS